MLISVAGRRLYYTLEGPENGQVVCFTHSLASDGGMWAEQLLASTGGWLSRAAPRYARPWRQ